MDTLRERIHAEPNDNCRSTLSCLRVLAPLVVVLFAARILPGQSLLSDNFAGDTSLNGNLWATDTSFLSSVAEAFGETWVKPQISFSTSGMTMSGVTGTYQFTGLQSRQAFSPPFSAQVTAMGTVANGNPFWLDLTSGDTSQYITIAGNLNPQNTPYYGISLGTSDPNYAGGVVLDESPSVNVWYTMNLAADANGQASVTFVDTYSGKILEAQSGIRLGSGPFYLVLGQYEGAPYTVGPNVGIWGEVQVTGGSAGATTPTISLGGVVNAASSVPGPVAPGSLAAVYGSFLISSPSTASGVPWPTILGGLSMQFAGSISAPLSYVSSGQSDMQVPWELGGLTEASLTASVSASLGAPTAVSLAFFAPGIFSINGKGTGQGAILDSSNNLVDSSNPATAGASYVQIYCTGLGPVSNKPATGAPASGNPLSMTTMLPTVTIGGVPAAVLFSGLAPGTVGLYQVNVQVPANSPTGNGVPVVVSIGGAVSNTVTMAVMSATNQNTYTVSFTESGLTAIGSSWSVTVNGTTVTGVVPAGTLGTINFQLPNGVYSYTATGTSGACPRTMRGNVSISGANTSMAIKFTAPTFFLPVTSGGESYSIAVFGDADQFSALTSGLNSSLPLYSQASYLLNSVLNPSGYPVNAIEVEDATGAPVVPSAQLITNALIWAYSYVNQSQLSQPCSLLSQAYQGRSLQSLGIDLVTGLEFADAGFDAASIASDLSGIALGPGDPGAIAAAFSLFGDILQGWSALQQDTSVKNASAVVEELVSLNLISSASGQNYTAAEVLNNLATLSARNTSVLASIVTGLYNSAYQQQISNTASQYAQNFLGQLIPSVQQSLISSALEGGYNFLLAYGMAQFPLSSSVYAAASGFAEGAVNGLVVAAASAVIQNYLLPLKDLLQAESSIEGTANTICSASTATFTPVQSGSADIDSAQAYAATSGFVYSLLASWFAYDAQLNGGEQSGAYTFAAVLSILGSSLANDFLMSAQQEASIEWFDEASAPVAESWTKSIGAFVEEGTSAANILVNSATCGVSGNSAVVMSEQAHIPRR